MYVSLYIFISYIWYVSSNISWYNFDVYLYNITCHESEPDLCQIMNDDECRFPNWPIMSAQCIFCLPNQLKVAFWRTSREFSEIQFVQENWRENIIVTEFSEIQLVQPNWRENIRVMECFKL